MLSDETNRRAARQSHYVSAEVASDAALDVLYGRFSQWVVGHVGVTPSANDAVNSTTYGNATFAAIAPTTPNIDFSTVPGLSDYKVSAWSIVPVNPDDTIPGSSTAPPGSSPFPDAKLSKTSSGGFSSAYSQMVNQYFSLVPNIYEPGQCTGGLTYCASVTISPTPATAKRAK